MELDSFTEFEEEEAIFVSFVEFEESEESDLVAELGAKVSTEYLARSRDEHPITRSHERIHCFNGSGFSTF